MERNLTIFESPDFGSVRTLTLDGEPLFVANDVCRILELANPIDAIRSLDSDEKMGVDIADPHGRVQKTNCITESGLYSLILRSRKSEARAFRRWITHEVIPSIRRSGAYMSGETLRMVLENPQLIVELAANLLSERSRAESLESELVLARPKADYYDAFVRADHCTGIRATAKELNVPERFFCKFLIKMKLLYRTQSGNLLPYNNPKTRGYFVVRDYHARSGHHGEYTLITPLGKGEIRIMLEREVES